MKITFISKVSALLLGLFVITTSIIYIFFHRESINPEQASASAVQTQSWLYWLDSRELNPYNNPSPGSGSGNQFVGEKISTPPLGGSGTSVDLNTDPDYIPNYTVVDLGQTLEPAQDPETYDPITSGDILLSDWNVATLNSYRAALSAKPNGPSDPKVLAYFEIGAIESHREGEYEFATGDSEIVPDLYDPSCTVDGYPEYHAAYWTDRWFQGIIVPRLDAAIAAGFDGGYLDMAISYEAGLTDVGCAGVNWNATRFDIVSDQDASLLDRNDVENRAYLMRRLIIQMNQYLSSIGQSDFLLIPQNAPELYDDWRTGTTHPEYLAAIDGIAIEDSFAELSYSAASNGTAAACDFQNGGSSCQSFQSENYTWAQNMKAAAGADFIMLASDYDVDQSYLQQDFETDGGGNYTETEILALDVWEQGFIPHINARSSAEELTYIYPPIYMRQSTPGNQIPVAVDDTYTIQEDTSIDTSADVGVDSVLSNDTDADVGDILTSAVLSDVSNGTLVLSLNGDFTYMPDQDYSGSDSFTYTVSDGNGGSDTGQVIITINEVNDPPTATDDSYTLQQGDFLPNGTNVLDNDDDIESPSVLTVTDFSAPSLGTLNIASNGDITYTAGASSLGTETITYTVSDSQGATDTATISITITEQDLPPVVNAGADVNITLAQLPHTFSPTITDPDDLLGELDIAWTLVSYTLPAGTTYPDIDYSIRDFNTPTAEFTAAYPGTYVISLSVSDDTSTITDNLVISLTGNLPPINQISSNISALLGETILVDADPIDYEGDVLSFKWSQASGPATVDIVGVEEQVATIEFPVVDQSQLSEPVQLDVGEYTFEIETSDASGSDTDVFTVNVTLNEAPVIDSLSFPQSIEGNTTSLTASVSDDTLPASESLTYTWSVISSPEGASVSFDPEGALSTEALFSQPGTYTIRFTASDSLLSSYEDFNIVVEALSSSEGSLSDTGLDISLLVLTLSTATAVSGVSLVYKRRK